MSDEWIVAGAESMTQPHDVSGRRSLVRATTRAPVLFDRLQLLRCHSDTPTMIPRNTHAAKYPVITVGKPDPADTTHNICIVIDLFSIVLCYWR